MATTKRQTSHTLAANGHSAVELSGPDKQSRDDEDMVHYGKQQRLKRNFGLIGICGLTCSTMGTWEGTILGSGPAFINGGPTGAFVGLTVGFVGAFLQTLVLAEMASMIPLSGGQYNWVAILAPPRVRNLLSYLVGWFTMLLWQAATASLVYLGAVLIQFLSVLSYGYTPQAWQVCLISYAILAAALFLNIFLSWVLPTFEAINLLVHVAGFFIVLVVMVYLTPQYNTADDVFRNFVNGGNFPTTGLSAMVGFISAFNGFLGIDTAAHLAEEVQNASRTVPAAMLTSLILNGVLGMGMLIAFLFCLGPLDQAYATLQTGGLPIANTFITATGSVGGGVGLAIIPLIVLLGGALGVLATVSRTTWAFAREGGLPFSNFLTRIPNSRAVPVNSLLLCVTVQVILATIGIGSPLALSAFFSLNVMGFYGVFIIAAGVMLHRRLTNADLRWGVFKLGIFGVPVTIAAIAFSIFGFFFAFWPAAANPGSQEFNWGVAVFCAVAVLCVSWWFISARNHYTGPRIDRRDLVVLDSIEPK